MKEVNCSGTMLTRYCNNDTMKLFRFFFFVFIIALNTVLGCVAYLFDYIIGLNLIDARSEIMITSKSLDLRYLFVLLKLAACIVLCYIMYIRTVGQFCSIVMY